MRSNSERGEGKLGTIVGLLVFVGVLMAAWNVLPIFIADYTFGDKSRLGDDGRNPRRRHRQPVDHVRQGSGKTDRNVYLQFRDPARS